MRSTIRGRGPHVAQVPLQLLVDVVFVEPGTERDEDLEQGRGRTLDPITSREGVDAA